MSYQNWDNFDDANEDELEGYQDVDWSGRDGVIFLIDATESMFEGEEQQGNGETEIFFRKALRCCHMTMLKKVIGSAKDLIGIVLFGTAQKENHLNLDHLYVLQSLQQPNIDKIKELDKMVKSDTCDNFRVKYGHSKGYVLQDVLWLCQSIFSNCELKMGMHRILIFTADDDPHNGNRIEQQRAIDRAHDLNVLNISLELLPLGSSFNMERFYKELVEIAMGEEHAEQGLGRCALNIEELLLRVCRYSHKKRSQGRHLLHLGSNVVIGVGIYSILRRQPMPKRMWLERKTNIEVNPTTHQFNVDTGEVVLEMDVGMYKSHGGQKVIFYPEETKLTTNILEPGFYVMGFKPRERVKLEYHFSKPYFLFPDENQMQGSRKLFYALLKQCSERKKVMICWSALREGAPPKLFTLIPQLAESNTETDVQEMPDGFLAFPLPLSGNIRPIGIEISSNPTEPQIEFMNKVVCEFTFHYNVHNFQNPDLQTLWAGIEALALEMGSSREIEDNTKPKYEVMERKLNKLGLVYDKIFSVKNSDVSLKNFGKTGVRRSGSKTDDATYIKCKQPKNVDAYVEEIVRTGKAGSLKVDQLKTYLATRGKAIYGKRKADLIDMIETEVIMDSP